MEEYTAYTIYLYNTGPITFNGIKTMIILEDFSDSLYTYQIPLRKKIGNFVSRTAAIPDPQYLILQT